MSRTPARIQACIAFEDGTIKSIALHSSLVATTKREAEKLAVFAEGGSVKRNVTRLDTYADGTPFWDVFLCANAKAARYWGPQATAARLMAPVETVETVETATVETATVETVETATVETVETATVETVETATVETATVETVETATVETVETATVETVETATVETVETVETATVETATVETVETATVETVETVETVRRKSASTENFFLHCHTDP